MFYTYILQNQKGQFYIGQTSNIEDRLKRHNAGRSKYTHKRGPWTVVYVEQYSTRQDACKREREIKRWKKKKRIEQLIALGAHTP